MAFFSNGTRIVKNITKNINTRPSYIMIGEFLQISPFILKNEYDLFFIYFKIDEKNYTRLLNQKIIIHNPIYFINSNNEIIENADQLKFYYLRNKLIYQAKRKK